MQLVTRIVKWTLIALVVAIIVVLLVASISAALSLDRNFNYTEANNRLPLLTNEAVPDDGLLLTRIAAGDFEFRARVAGISNTGGVVILLHGFPETSAMWSPMIQPLADAGYRVFAFDQRGYSPGARPLDVSSYGISHLTDDVIAIADAISADEFHLVGHDWGAVVGWNVTLEYPERVKSWTALSIAHPLAFGDALANDPDQQSRSSYIGLFVTPYIPEILFSFNDFALLRGLYQPMFPEQRDEYLALFAEPEALSSALNWYRASDGLARANPEGQPYINTPTLFIWGNGDTAAGRWAVENQEQYMRGPYQFVEIDGDHWLMESHGGQITEAVLEHLERNP